MTRRLKAFPYDVRTGNRSKGEMGRHKRVSKYPWDVWMDGSVWRIRRGEDFDIATKAMLSALYIRARRFENTAVRASHKQEEPDTIVFQFYEDKSPALWSN